MLQKFPSVVGNDDQDQEDVTLGRWSDEEEEELRNNGNETPK